jgi:glycosyltransferase involved in cell wall biosynthesis
MSPLKLFEYMAAGRPIVCSDLPVLREILQHERTALLCDPDDAASWAGALARLHDEPTLRRTLAEAARAQFELHFTWKARADRVLGGL